MITPRGIVSLNRVVTGIDHFVDNTRINNLACEAIPVDVSIGPAWWARCEHLTSCLCLTLVFDHVAAELGIDPIEVALQNDGCHGHDTEYLDQYKHEHGFPERDSLKECIEIGKQAINWDEKWHLPGTKKLPNGKLHGIAFTWDHNWDDTRGTGSAAVMIENDGSVSIIGQHVDIGPNPWTPLCQIVADEIGIPFESVHIKPWTVDTGFVLMSPYGSCNLDTNGNIVRKAAQKARQMLLELAAEQFEVASPEELDIRDGIIVIKADPTRSKPLREVVARSLPMHCSGAFWTQPPIIGWAWHNQGIWGQANETGRLIRYRDHLEALVKERTIELNEANDQLQQRLAWLSAVIRVHHRITGVDKLSASYQELSAQILHFLKARLVFVLRWDSQDEAFDVVSCSLDAAGTYNMQALKTLFEKERGLRSEIEQGKLLICSRDEDPSLSELFLQCFPAQEVASLILAPLAVGPSVIGVLGIAVSGTAEEMVPEKLDLVARMALDGGGIRRASKLAHRGEHPLGNRRRAP